MSINPKDLIEHIIRPALKSIDRYCLASEQLVAGTCAVESDMGSYLVQKGGGGALGIFQMERATHKDMYLSYLNHRPALKRLVLRGCYYSITAVPDEILVCNLRYAAIMCRLKYSRDPNALPAYNDIQGQAEYWKKVYNTPLGKGTTEKFQGKFDLYLRQYYFGYSFEP